MLATGYGNGGGRRVEGLPGGAYHQVNDDMSQKIDWESGARFARLNYLISRDLANADRRPLWYKGDYFADQFAPGAPRAVARGGGRRPEPATAPRASLAYPSSRAEGTRHPAAGSPSHSVLDSSLRSQ